MSYWLLKTEPSVYSYKSLEREKTAVWDGVSNNLALKYIRMMKKNDLAFVYHSGDERAIVGIAEIVDAPYADPKQHDPKLVVVDIKPKKQLARPVSLTEIKTIKTLASFDLVRIPRLSVMPVTPEQWKKIMALSK